MARRDYYLSWIYFFMFFLAHEAHYTRILGNGQHFSIYKQSCELQCQLTAVGDIGARNCKIVFVEMSHGIITAQPYQCGIKGACMMIDKTLFAPEVDNLIQRASGANDAPDEATAAQVRTLMMKLSAIETCGEDERREIWLWAERGTIDNFGDYDAYFNEGEVENNEEFEELWQYYYPDER